MSFVNSMKKDNLDALILLSAHVLAEQNEQAFLSVDTSDVVRPKSLDRKVSRMIKREQQRRDYGSFFVTAKRVVAAFLIICTVSFAMAMSVDAMRAAIWKIIVEWYDEYIAVIYETDNDIPEVIEIKHEPTDIPQGWTKQVVLDSPSMYVICYSIDDEQVMIYQQYAIGGSNWNDNENSSAENVMVRDFEGALLRLLDEGTYILEWSDGEYAYTLSTSQPDIESEWLVAIAESVK